MFWSTLGGDRSAPGGSRRGPPRERAEPGLADRNRCAHPIAVRAGRQRERGHGARTLFCRDAAGYRTWTACRPLASSAATDERIVLSLTEAADVGNGEWSFGVAPTFSQVVYYRGDHPDGPLRLATLAIPIGDAMLSPVPFAGGLLTPIKDGTVTCMDPVSGGPKLQPFHPSVPTGIATQWNVPADSGRGTGVRDRQCARADLSRRAEGSNATRGIGVSSAGK